jgi:hypothetical protein
MTTAALTSEEIVKRIQNKIAEQNEVIREQQIQIQEQQQKVLELEQKITELQSAESDRNDVLSKLAELVD